MVEGLRFAAARPLARAYAAGDGPGEARRWHRRTTVAGGLALLAAAGALPLLPPAIGATPVVLPLVIAHLAAQVPPVLFGLGGVALNMAGRERARRWLLWRAVALAAPCLAAAALGGALPLALTHAAVHRAQGAAAARPAPRGLGAPWSIPGPRSTARGVAARIRRSVTSPACRA
ncbi:MAG: hypothetical protein ACE368_20570 [Paracoccaceae bacterium]